MSANTVLETLQAYLSAWTESSDAKRQELLQQSWADDGRYTDPISDILGRDAMMNVLTGFAQQHPGHAFVLASAIDQHHNLLRFSWRFEHPDGSTIFEGMDFAELADDGRLMRIVGFY